jgi:hypothetical protein
MPFIPPMLISRLTDAALLADPRYVAKPKLDGQRAQVHVERGRTVAVYSRPGRELRRHRGLAWLRDVRWPLSAAIRDGELFSGEGAEGIDAILTARNGDGSGVALAEVLHCAPDLVPRGDWGQSAVMAFAYRDPRSGELVTVEQAVRVPYSADWQPRRGPAEILCWGLLRSGLLRHPLQIGQLASNPGPWPPEPGAGTFPFSRARS